MTLETDHMAPIDAFPEFPGLSEPDVVQRAASGNREAFGALFDHYVDEVHDFAIHAIGFRPEAEAATDTTFTAVMQMLERNRHNPNEPFKVALYRHAVASTTASFGRLRQMYRRIHPGRSEDLIDPIYLQFTFRKRQILALMYRARFSLEEGADILGTDPESLAEEIESCRERLRTLE